MLNKKRKGLTVLLSLILVTAGAWAADVTFTVTPLVRTNWGLLQEYVFHDNDGNGTPEYTMSRLDWDINWITSYGGLLTFGIRTEYNHTFTLNASYILGITAESGRMQDYDWYHLEQGKYCGTLTNYSSHPNYLTDLMDVSLSGGWTLPSGIGIDIGWDIRQLSFVARGGFRQYGEGISLYSTGHVDLATQPKEYYPADENVISYEFLCNYLRLGITYTLKKDHFPELYCGIWGIPLYAAQALDRHLARTENFLDVMYGYNCGLSEVIALSFPLLPNSRVYIREDGEYINTIKGQTYYTKGEKMPSIDSIPNGWDGSSRYGISLTVGYTICF